MEIDATLDGGVAESHDFDTVKVCKITFTARSCFHQLSIPREHLWSLQGLKFHILEPPFLALVKALGQWLVWQRIKPRMAKDGTPKKTI